MHKILIFDATKERPASTRDNFRKVWHAGTAGEAANPEGEMKPEFCRSLFE
jgi:hypothetical protein